VDPLPASAAETLTHPATHRGRGDDRVRQMPMPDEPGLFRMREPRVADTGETTEAELPRRKRFLFF
jgi:hypothetical protein